MEFTRLSLVQWPFLDPLLIYLFSLFLATPSNKTCPTLVTLRTVFQISLLRNSSTVTSAWIVEISLLVQYWFLALSSSDLKAKQSAYT